MIVVEGWIARSIQHGDCQAIRLPDGVWAATNDDKFGFGGPVPGCLPWPCKGAMSNCAMGPGLVGGFFYNAGVLGLPRPNRWRIIYGITASATFLGRSLGTADRQRSRRSLRPALGVPRHGGCAVRELAVGILPGARIRRPQ